MPPKIKPSTKEYIKVNNKMTNKFRIIHYTPSNTKTEDLIKYYDSPSYKRKKEMIRKELVKRGVWENLKKK
jgi:pantoate kinase|tara:strand:- start:652 stop:864 length:213 start_codon:yes stop_codon:yes gene_type:complete